MAENDDIAELRSAAQRIDAAQAELLGARKGLGERMRAVRVAHGLTLADVASAAGLSVPYVSEMERGTRSAQAGAVRALLWLINNQPRHSG